MNKGRHTTVGGYLHPLPGDDGGYVADTPGLREIGMWGLAPESLDVCFPELRPYLPHCRFADCRTSSSPTAPSAPPSKRGEVSVARYESYLKLRGELEEEQ